MFPNPQAALPLPRRPNLERYRKLAKELLKACRAGESAGGLSVQETSIAIRKWASAWVLALLEHAEGEIRDPEANVKARIDEVASFAARTMSGPDNCTLTKAQFVIARSHGFRSWPQFLDHLRGLAKADSEISTFESAADSIISGDTETLRRLLERHPQLVRQRSTREHRSTLLHYVSANGVEDYRQRTPKNVVEITRMLLDAGSEVDAGMSAYEGDCTALGLAATSVHPEKMGVQEELMELLLERGAMTETAGVAGRRSMLVAACLANGRAGSAKYLAEHGAPLDIEAAAGLGRLDIVQQFFDENGELKPPTTKQEMQRGFLWACQYGHENVVEYLLERGADLRDMAGTNETALHMAVIGAKVSTVKLLLSRGAGLEDVNGYGGTPLEQAGYSFKFGDPKSDYVPIFEVLLSAGAKIQKGWLEWIAAVESRSGAEKEKVAELFARYGAED